MYKRGGVHRSAMPSAIGTSIENAPPLTVPVTERTNGWLVSPGWSAGTVTGNTANGNTGDGIEALSGCTISGNNTNSNGDDGITAGAGSVLIGNTARSNVDFGCELGAGGSYGENLLASNNASDPGDARCVQVSPSSALELAANSCNGSSCYCLPAGPLGDILCRIPRINLPLHPSDPGTCSP